MTVIKVKPSRVRKPPKPRTCCPTHNDTCRFGRDHVWAGPYYQPNGTRWSTWRDDGSVICAECGAICEAEVQS